jgi:hypothetical protein
MNSIQAAARRTGVLYLLFAMVAVPKTVRQNASDRTTTAGALGPSSSVPTVRPSAADRPITAK